MAGAALFISWGAAVAGRERQALRLFDESVEHWTALRQAHVLAHYEALLLEPHGGDLAGCFILHGEATALARLREEAAFQRLSMRAALVLTHYRVVSAYGGEALNRRVACYGALAAELA